VTDVELTPLPGDLVVALKESRAWESELVRNLNGDVIQVGEIAMVLYTYDVGAQLRMHVLRNNRIMLFSCARRVWSQNWKIASRIEPVNVVH